MHFIIEQLQQQFLGNQNNYVPQLPTPEMSALLDPGQMCDDLNTTKTVLTRKLFQQMSNNSACLRSSEEDLCWSAELRFLSVGGKRRCYVIVCVLQSHKVSRGRIGQIFCIHTTLLSRALYIVFAAHSPINTTFTHSTASSKLPC